MQGMVGLNLLELTVGIIHQDLPWQLADQNPFPLGGGSLAELGPRDCGEQDQRQQVNGNRPATDQRVFYPATGRFDRFSLALNAPVFPRQCNRCPAMRTLAPRAKLIGGNRKPPSALIA